MVFSQIAILWVGATFNNDQEAWSNWRRTGNPELTPNVDADIPRRNQYPEDEITKNNTNYQKAIGKLSNGDTFYSKVWWDIK
ncbi:MAG: SusD/RagB family nutrient-binding outer membrane lipoprotein [Cyclobacteriaceae bacterium]|nr:SusD/RagB family nutrient-binding outer membrane lipoprotein [Cyclobacteriaceae bacterium]